MKWIKRLFILFVVLLLLAAGTAYGAVKYIAPEETLDLEGAPLDLLAKVQDAALQLKPEITISEEELNGLFKSYLSDNSRVAEDIELTGARFELREGMLNSFLNVMYADRVEAGVNAVYRLSWSPPYLVAEPVNLTVRGFALPLHLLEPMRFEVLPELPSWIVIQAVTFGDRDIIVRFKADLRQGLNFSK